MSVYVRDVYNIHAGGLLTTPTATPRRVAEDQLVQLQRQFARPIGINEAYDLLAAEHTVIIHGARGTGRSSTARILLCELPRDGTYHEITPEKPDSGSGSGRWLSPELVGERDRMLLDLSVADDQTWNAVHEELSDFRHAVLAKRAYLAVVLPRRFHERLSPQFVKFSRRIGRPDGLEVVVRHLRLAGVDEDARRIAPRALLEHLETNPPMRELALLAHRIADARGPGDFASWCATALEAQKNRAQEAADVVRQLRKGRQRALLLAAAMLHGARAEAVHRATNLLVEVAGSAHDDRPILEHKGLSARLKAVRAELDAESRVCFSNPDFAEAARRHFWADLPDVRDPLNQWLSKAIGLSELDPTDLAGLVERFTDLCVHTGDFDRLTTLIEHWTRDGANRSTEVRAAAHVLKRGVEREQSNSHFRARIYDWSTARPSKNHREVLAEVCEKVMSVQHPEAALVRLHHLARNEPHPDVARAALFRYVNQDSRLQRRLLARLATAQNSRHHRADADLFLDLAELPDHFLLTASTREWLTTCWRMAFDLLTPDRWAPCAANWLSTADAVDDTALAAAAPDILVVASELRYPVLSRIYADARRTVSPRLTSRLLDSITLTQRTRLTQQSPDSEVSSP
ncbi:ATP-binding protein [Streptomyces sp. ISL-22]|uniref:ATP-binding protein n=1 Tax=unclassified Streptomyces TaxID=2593676 RepID=UPI001BE81EAA|nr:MULTISPECIES: ATP-binding protein [unclassified Streptomyces]MBT2419822.1 ATP-binding protein [Streptomyces sp. ISL-24]MBT2435213.1 ATP-binding protein [Streptomyces sp. ISL-22]